MSAKDFLKQLQAYNYPIETIGISKGAALLVWWAFSDEARMARYWIAEEIGIDITHEHFVEESYEMQNWREFKDYPTQTLKKEWFRK